MPRVLVLILLTLLPLGYAGCEASAEDRDFYYRGWLNPRELDHDTPRHRYLRPQPEPGKVYQRDPLVD